MESFTEDDDVEGEGEGSTVEAHKVDDNLEFVLARKSGVVGVGARERGGERELEGGVDVRGFVRVVGQLAAECGQCSADDSSARASLVDCAAYRTCLVAEQTDLDVRHAARTAVQQASVLVAGVDGDAQCKRAAGVRVALGEHSTRTEAARRQRSDTLEACERLGTALAVEDGARRVEGAGDCVADDVCERVCRDTAAAVRTDVAQQEARSVPRAPQLVQCICIHSLCTTLTRFFLLLTVLAGVVADNGCNGREGSSVACTLLVGTAAVDVACELVLQRRCEGA